MQEYTGFAQVYDTFMDNVPYDEWSEYLTTLLSEFGVREGLVLELGCGTGKMTRRLASRGYDMIGIDYSEEMLEIAREKEYERVENDCEEYEDISECEADYECEVDSNTKGKKIYDNRILYLQQDMRNFELFGTVAAVVSICDSMNYITSEQDLVQVFKLVNNYLDARGVFIFDMNTEYKYKKILSDNTIAENREECSFIWENYYNEDTMINVYDVTVFVKIEVEEDELEMSETSHASQIFERFQETHYQKAYSIETVKKLLIESGMEFVAVYDAFTHSPPTNSSERVYFIAREKHQEYKKYI